MTGLLQKVSLYFKDREHKLGELVVDAFLTETHELRSLVTERPTERGVSFVDHIYHLPLRLELTGIISNTPMTLVGLTAFTSYKNFAQDFRQFDGTAEKADSNNLALQAFKKLEEIFAKREPITIATSLKDYANMVLENLSIEREGNYCDVVRFCCSAVQIRVVLQKHIAIPKVKAALPKKDLSKQEALPLTNTSILKTLKEMLMGQ
jgi:hypothetical protein